MKHGIHDVRFLRQSTLNQDRRDAVLQLSDLYDGKYSQDKATGFIGGSYVANWMKALGYKAFEYLRDSKNLNLRDFVRVYSTVIVGVCRDLSEKLYKCMLG